MPQYSTQSRRLLDKVGDDGVQLDKWANYHSETQIWCTLCSKPVAVGHGGINQVNQHIKTDSHRKRSRARFSTSQCKFEKVGNGKVEFFKKSPETRKCEAEALWCFKVAEEDWSFQSSDHCDLLFKRMFGEEAAKLFSVGHSKLSYIARHGLSDVLLQDLVVDISKCVGTYTVMLDETTTAQVKKQCDFLVKYWSEREDEVSTRYLTSEFFAHTSAAELQKMVMQVLERSDISTEKFANLAVDGPNINKSLHGSLHLALKEGTAHPGLLPFNPCVLHKVHTGFHNGIMEYGHDAENLAFDLHSWFKISPCKREDFMLASVDFQSEVIFAVFKQTETLYYRHVETRWLTLIPALEKVEERWLMAKKYFLEYLPSTKDFNKSTASNKRYIRISSSLQKNEKFILLQIAFVVDVSSCYQSFLTIFQTAGPQIHVLYRLMKSLVTTLMYRFLKFDVVNNLNGRQLQNLDVTKKENQLEMDKIEIGAKAKRLIKDLQPYDQKKEREKMLKFLITSVQFLQKKLPFDNNVLAAADCLHPERRSSAKSVQQIEFLAKSFPHVVTENEISRVKDEWKMYQAETAIDTSKGRIDHYWRKIFKYELSTGGPKYSTLAKLVKSVMSVHHGNSDVERSLSDNKNSCTKERTALHPETLIGLRRMKEYARNVGGAHNITVTQEMIEGMKTAWRKNDERIAQEKKDQKNVEEKLLIALNLEKEQKKLLKEADVSKKSLEETEESFLEAEKELNNELLLTKRMLDDANRGLKEAIAKKDMLGIQVASELITSTQEKMSTTEILRDKHEKERAVIGKKRKNTIDTMFSKIKESYEVKTISKSKNRKVDDIFSQKEDSYSSETITKPAEKKSNERKRSGSSNTVSENKPVDPVGKFTKIIKKESLEAVVPSKKKLDVNFPTENEIQGENVKVNEESKIKIKKLKKPLEKKKGTAKSKGEKGMIFRALISSKQRSKTDHLKEILMNGTTNIDFSKNVIDEIGSSLLPTDVLGLPENAVVLKSKANGNCLFNSVSIALTGEESLSGVLRMATSKKLSEDKHLFSSHPAIRTAAKIARRTDEYLFPITLARSSQTIYDKSKNRNESIKAEADRLSKDKEWGSLMALFGLAEVIKRPIFSIYPNVPYTLRALFHQIIIPEDNALVKPIYILWSKEGGLDSSGQFSPNHFVPVVTR